MHPEPACLPYFQTPNPVLTALQDSYGCTEMCGDGSPFIRDYQRWQGMLTLPRQVVPDLVTGTLVFFPVNEMETLRLAPPLYPQGVSQGRQSTALRTTAEPLVLPTVSAAAAAAAAANKTRLHGLPSSPEVPQSFGPACLPEEPGTASLVLVPEHASAGAERRQLEIRARFGIATRPSSGNGSPSEPDSAPFQAGITLITGVMGRNWCQRYPWHAHGLTSYQEHLTYQALSDLSTSLLPSPQATAASPVSSSAGRSPGGL